MDFLNNPNTIYWSAFANGSFNTVVSQFTLEYPISGLFISSIWGCFNVILSDILMSFIPQSAHFIIPLAMYASIALKAYDKVKNFAQ